MKLANPLQYPLAVLAGAFVLVGGVRLAAMPSVVVFPLAIGIAVAGATVQKSREPEQLNLGNPEMEKQLLGVRQQAKQLAGKTHELRQEATRLLTQASQMDLLAEVQYACDRAEELPTKLEELTHRFQSRDSLLSMGELQQQLAEAESRRQKSSGVAREQLNQLVEGLRRNLKLVQQGQDARQAQVANLAMVVTNTAGVLQALQNKLRIANLADADQTLELRSLSEELRQFQDNVDLLISK